MTDTRKEPDVQSEREAFEAAMRKHRPNIDLRRHPGDYYIHDRTLEMWRGWQACVEYRTPSPAPEGAAEPVRYVPWTDPHEAVPCENTRVFAETREGALIFCTYRDEEWQSSNGVHCYAIKRWMSEEDLRAMLTASPQPPAASAVQIPDVPNAPIWYLNSEAAAWESGWVIGYAAALAAVPQEAEPIPNLTTDERGTRTVGPDDGLKQSMPNPTAMDLVDPMFNAIWNATKTWDVNAPEYYVGYCGLNGSHVMLILNAVRAALASQKGQQK